MFILFSQQIQDDMLFVLMWTHQLVTTCHLRFIAKVL